MHRRLIVNVLNGTVESDFRTIKIAVQAAEEVVGGRLFETTCTALVTHSLTHYKSNGRHDVNRNNMVCNPQSNE